MNKEKILKIEETYPEKVGLDLYGGYRILTSEFVTKNETGSVTSTTFMPRCYVNTGVLICPQCLKELQDN
ncbi:MAG: hypothetical protein GY861_22330 [bacterium]|nr:hypothetical protein [bacterium]